MNIPEMRPLGANEKVFWILDQKVSTHFAIATEIEGNISVSAWRNALNTVQERHPNLSVQLNSDEYQTLQFQQVKGVEIPMRILDLGKDENWDKEIEKELQIRFSFRKGPLVRTLLMRQAGKSVLVVISNHSIGDGMSVTLLIRDLLSILGGETLSDLITLPSIDELIGIALQEAEIPHTDPTSFYPGGVTETALDESFIKRVQLSAALTAKLLERAKREKTSVHGALSVALVLAKKQITDHWNNKPVRVMHPVSARKILGLGDSYGLYLNLITTPYVFNTTNSFWKQAREARESIAVTQSREWIKADVSNTNMLFNSGMDLKAIEEILVKGTWHDIMITNLGQLPLKTQYGALKLVSFWGPMVLTPHKAAQTVGVCTVNGHLTMTLTSYMPADGLLEAAEQILLEACEIGEMIAY